uniref:Adiponectin receptor protein n=1 Tax=Syphacia muris TaxID=451379 RepID=A0A0N5AAN0_9BILA
MDTASVSQRLLDSKEDDPALREPESSKYDDDVNNDDDDGIHSDYVKRPMVHVGGVLQEAVDIVSERGTSRVKSTEDSEVLVDEVDVQYSPRHDQRPIEIIVRHNTVVSKPGDRRSFTSSASSLGRSQPYVLRTIMEGKESNELEVADGTLQKQKFRKGHRRAFSVPNANGSRVTLSVTDKDESLRDGLHKRHSVRYRIKPYNREISTDDAMLVDDSAPFLVSVLKIPDNAEENNELEIEINEEEILCSPNDEISKSGPRTVIKKFWEARWKVTNFEFLPEWLQDNEYLRTGHRPPLPSFGSCFKSIFSLHTETGNIWTHMYGCVAFMGVAAWFLTRPSYVVPYQEKIVFAFFFVGAITCMGMSFAFHTLQCHSIKVGRFFSKLDYTGISLLIVGSFIPFLYYAFYCRPLPMFIYSSSICVLGVCAVIVSLWDKFAEPKFRPVRAGVFLAMGLSSIVPVLHLWIIDGLRILLEQASFHWLVLMGVLYITGALLYATRTPERCFPGKCDLWFQSHQLFHMFVIAAAFVHFYGITTMAVKRLEQGSCAEQLLERYGTEHVESSIISQFLGWEE